MKIKSVVIFLLLCVVTLSAITLIQYYNEDVSELELARKTSKARFFESEQGVTRLQVFGEKNTPTVILIHSFNGFIESWNPNIKALTNAGYRVVAYDLFGRGLSDRPRAVYDLKLFRTQLENIVNAVDAKNVHLVGSSFGAVIASDYALSHPSEVDSLVFVGPAGWPQDGGRNMLLDVPLLSDVVFHYFGERILRPKVEAYLFNLSMNQEVVEEWASFARYPGFTRAALSTLKNSPVLDYTSGWKELGGLAKPTLFIWGHEDVSFPYTSSEKVPELIPHAQVMGIDDAAHWVNIEQPDQVNNAVISFLNTYKVKKN